eukprot:TRINITY_DN1419_c0_g1_i1.p1 TRINITY_DN1419_c0_g1~~TRINITY_DN1419_c0_g1_i1.p1  ORF type:complete len:708 (+),score=219.90 TRINITY_DN1419_c0_g1_i1:111-2126(+)
MRRAAAPLTPPRPIDSDGSSSGDVGALPVFDHYAAPRVVTPPPGSVAARLTPADPAEPEDVCSGWRWARRVAARSAAAVSEQLDEQLRLRAQLALSGLRAEQQEQRLRASRADAAALLASDAQLRHEGHRRSRSADPLRRALLLYRERAAGALAAAAAGNLRSRFYRRLCARAARRRHAAAAAAAAEGHARVRTLARYWAALWAASTPRAPEGLSADGSSGGSSAEAPASADAAAQTLDAPPSPPTAGQPQGPPAPSPGPARSPPPPARASGSPPPRSPGRSQPARSGSPSLPPPGAVQQELRNALDLCVAHAEDAAALRKALRQRERLHQARWRRAARRRAQCAGEALSGAGRRRAAERAFEWWARWAAARRSRRRAARVLLCASERAHMRRAWAALLELQRAAPSAAAAAAAAGRRAQRAALIGVVACAALGRRAVRAARGGRQLHQAAACAGAVGAGQGALLRCRVLMRWRLWALEPRCRPRRNSAAARRRSATSPPAATPGPPPPLPSPPAPPSSLDASRVSRDAGAAEGPRPSRPAGGGAQLLAARRPSGLQLARLQRAAWVEEAAAGWQDPTTGNALAVALPELGDTRGGLLYQVNGQLRPPLRRLTIHSEVRIVFPGVHPRRGVTMPAQHVHTLLPALLRLAAAAGADCAIADASGTRAAGTFG